MRKIYFVVSLIIVILVLSGCGAKQKMEDKITEKLVESAFGGNVDIKGDEVTIKGEEGNVTFGLGDWPNSEIAKKIPEFKDGKITSAVNSEKYALIIIEDVDEENFKDYYEKVKSDFSKDSYDAKFESTISYTGSNDEGITMIISYSTSDKSLSIQASQAEKNN